MSLCIAVAGEVAVLAISAFTLAWTHSVERIAWEEDWQVTPAGLEIVEARVRGSGAGMEPPEGARLEGGWWVYAPGVAAVPELVLAASGATEAWRLCAGGTCIALGAEAGPPVRLAGCPDRTGKDETVGNIPAVAPGAVMGNAGTRREE